MIRSPPVSSQEGFVDVKPNDCDSRNKENDLVGDPWPPDVGIRSVSLRIRTLNSSRSSGRILGGEGGAAESFDVDFLKLV